MSFQDDDFSFDDDFQNELSTIRELNPEPPEPVRTVGGTLQDVGISAVKGAIGLPEAAVGIADIFTGGHAGKALEEVGYKPGESKEILEDFYSPAQKKANRAVQEADGFIDTVGTALSNPSTIAHTTLESLPAMVGGGGVARGLTKVAPKLISPALAAGVGEGVVGGGMAAEGIRGQNEDRLLTGKQSALAALSGGFTAAFGIAGNKIANKLGIGDVDVLLAGGKVPAGEQKNIVRRFLEGAFSEGVLEELPQSLSEQAIENIALGKDIMDNMDYAAAMGVLAGAAMGGPVAAFSKGQSDTGPAAGDQPAVDPNNPDNPGNLPAVMPGGVATPYTAPEPKGPLGRATALLPDANFPELQALPAPDRSGLPAPESQTLGLPAPGGDQPIILGQGDAPNPAIALPTANAFDVTGRADERQAVNTPIQQGENNALPKMQQPGSETRQEVSEPEVRPQDAEVTTGYTPQDGDILTSKSQPYATESKAQTAMMSRGLVKTHEPVSVDGGFVLRLTAKAKADADKKQADADYIEEVSNDPRLNRQAFRDALVPFVEARVDKFDGDLVGKKIMDADGKTVEDAIRSSNTQDIQPIIAAAGGVSALVNAATKASKGQKLGPAQAQAVSMLLDLVSQERTERVVPEARERLQAQREVMSLARATAVDMGEISEDAPEVTDDDFSGIERDEYPESWGEEAKSIADLSRAASEYLDDDAVMAILETDADNATVAARLYSAISEGKANEQREPRSSSLPQEESSDAQGRQEAPTAEPSEEVIASNDSSTGDKRYLKDSSYGMEKLAPKLSSEEGSTNKEFIGTSPTDGVVEEKFSEGEVGNRNHITLNESVWVPVSILSDLPGVMGEERKFTSKGFGNYTQTEWTRLKKDILTNGIKHPIFVTKDHGGGFEVSEGNHRIAAAVQLGLTHMPVHVRYFGKSEESGRILPLEKQATAEPLSEQTEAGDQTKLFATPPTFGKKPQTGQGVGKNDLDFSLSEPEAGLFDEPAAGSGPEIWQLTEKENAKRIKDMSDGAVRSELIAALMTRDGFSKEKAEAYIKGSNLREMHNAVVPSSAVEQALLRGEDIPDNVLNEHPYLTESADETQPSDGPLGKFLGGYTVKEFGDMHSEAERILLKDGVEPGSYVMATLDGSTLDKQVEPLYWAALALGSGKYTGGNLSKTKAEAIESAGKGLSSEPAAEAKPDPLAKAKAAQAAKNEKPAAPSLNIGDTFEYNGDEYMLDDVTGGRVETSLTDNDEVVTWDTIDEFQAETGQEINFGQDPIKAAEPEAEGGMTLLEAQNALIEVRTLIEAQGPVADARLMDKERQLVALVKELSEEESPAQAEPEQKAKPEETDKEKAAKDNQANEYGAGNKLVSADRAAELRARLRAKLDGRVGSGVDPELIALGTELAVFHIEAGARSFAKYARKMVADLGDSAKPFLKSWYMGAKFFPGIDGEGMDTPATVEALNIDDITEGVAEAPEADIVELSELQPTEEAQDDRNNEASNEESGQPVRNDGQGTADAGDRTPGRVEPEATQPAKNDQAAFTFDAESSGTSAQGDKRPNGGRVSTPRSGRNSPSRVYSDKAGDRPNREDRGGQSLEPSEIPGANYHITDDFQLGRGEAAKYADNVSALRILKEIRSKKRLATPEEQTALARYVGWGGLANAFRKPDGSIAKGWEGKVEEIEALLTQDELDTARNSTQFAHYTSKEVVDGLWSIVQHLGFKGGNALEPAMGTGNFLGMAPVDLAGSTHFTGVEYDSLTAGIAAALYPQSNVVKSGFEKLPIPANSFDLVIGNPPFSQNKLRFKFKPDFNRFSMHNQFVLAGMDALMPGGIQAFVVSRYFMDAKSSAARAKIAEQADLIGAFRLPDTAFKANAGTEVITDIIILQKREPTQTDGEGKVIPTVSNGISWAEVEEISDPLGGEPMPVNQYFAANPQNIIGTLDRSGSQNQHSDITVHLDGGRSIADEIASRVKTLPKNIAVQASPQEKSTQAFKDMQASISIALRGGEVGNVVFTESGGLAQVYEKESAGGDDLFAERVLTEDSPWHNDLQQNKDGKWYEIVDKLDADGKAIKVTKNGKATKRNVKETKVYESTDDIPATKKLGKLGYKRLEAAVSLINTLVDQINLENTQDSTDAAITKNRKKLKRQYNEIVKEHGYLNANTMGKIADSLPNGALLRSLEAKYKKPVTAARAKALGIEPSDAVVKPADILSERIIYPYEVPTSAESANDALAITLSEIGGVDVSRIAELIGKTPAEVINELNTKPDNPVIFSNPETGQWETADEYLGGNVVRKLEAAKAADLAKNVDALENVQPEPWSADKVTVIAGATWVPGKTYSDFVEHLTGEPGSVIFSRLTNTFAVRGKTDTAGAQAWNTQARNVLDLFGNILNSQPIKVTYKDEDGKTNTDQTATQAAIDMAELIKEEFTDWVFKDTNRRRELVDLFNKKFNVRVTRQRDGSHLSFPGKVPDHIIELRRHQVNGIWRGIVDRFVLYDHAVGAGKTFTAIARAMERRRMGLSKKPMMVVPNHILDQVAKDVYALYPGAKILALSTKDLGKDKRKRMFARIATGDWDMVIVPHSSFQFIGISPETEERYLQEELDAAIEAVKEAEEEAAENNEGGWKKPLTVKEAERLRDNIQAKLDKVKEQSTTKDRLLTFEQMGVDDLTVDESHEFKNLFYHSRLNVRGMNPKAGSGKAYDLWSKVRVLRESKNGSVAFMTGTPVSNSAVELYGIMRYLAPEGLEEMGLEHFDAWRTQFSTVTTAFEPKDSGRGLKEVNRIGRDWSNMRSLMDLYYSFGDAVSNDDIKKWYAEDNDGADFPIPKVKGGGRRAINVEPSAMQEQIIEQIVAGFDSLPDIKDVDERNAERLRLMDRAKKVSLDSRALNPFAQDDGKGGKLDRASEEITRIYNATTKDKGTQVVFLDRSVPKAKGDAAKIKEYDSLVRRLEQAEANGSEAEAMKLNDQLEKYDHSEMVELKAAAQGGWNAYDEIKRNLIARGVPESEIRFIHDANTEDQKKELFEEVNSGKVRVLIGNTPRMGAGTNVQERLVALHHIDVTYKPSDIEQREGRIIRQGNSLLEKYGDAFEVEIIAYTTNKTVDAKMWSLNATKLKMINGLRQYTGDFNLEFDDSDAVGMAEIAAIASGEPLQLERVQLTSEIDKLNRQKSAHRRRIYGLEDEIEQHERALKNKDAAARLEKYDDTHAKIVSKAEERTVTVAIDGQETAITFEEIAQTEADIKQWFSDNEKTSVQVGGKKYTSTTAAHNALRETLGDAAPMEATFGGKEFIRRSDLDKAIAQKVSEVFEEHRTGQEMDEKPAGRVTIGNIEVELTAQVVTGRKGDRGMDVEVFAEAKDGDTWLVQAQMSGSLGLADINLPSVVSGLSSKIVRQVRQLEGSAAVMYERMAKAEELLPKLKELVQAPFPKEQEIVEKETRLNEVEAELASEAEAAAGTDNIPLSRTSDLEQNVERLTARVAHLESKFGKIVTSWKNAPKLHVVKTEADLPNKIQSEIRKAIAEGQVRGVFFDGNKVYMVAANIANDAIAEEVLLHEALGHYGARALFGKDYRQAMGQLYLALGGGVGIRKLAEKYGINLNDYLDNSAHLTRENYEEMMVDELLAHLQQDNVKPSLVQKVIAAIRNALRGMGFDLKMNDSDLLRLLGQMRDVVVNGEAGEVIVLGPRFSKNNDGNGPTKEYLDKTYDAQGGKRGKVTADTEADYARFTERQEAAQSAGTSQADGARPEAVQDSTQEPQYESHTLFDHGELGDIAREFGEIASELLNSGLTMADVKQILQDEINHRSKTDEAYLPKIKALFDKTTLSSLAADYPAWSAANEGSAGAESVRFSRRPHGGIGPSPATLERASSRVKTAIDYLRMKFQDKFIPLLRAQEKLEADGWVKTNDNDAYRAEELFHGKAQKRLEDFYDKTVTPLIDRIKASSVDIAELEDYLYAKFAPQRNAYVASINEDMPEGGSGMTDEEAQSILDRFDAEGKTAELERLAVLTREVTALQREIIRNEGLEVEETMDAWEFNNPDYVPLKGGKEDNGRKGVGTGFNVKRSGTKQALGRRSKADNILAHLFEQTGATIVRAEKAKVGRAFLAMAEENAGSSLFKIHTKLPMRKAKVGGEVKNVVDLSFPQNDNVLTVTLEDGTVKYVEIFDDDLSRVMKNLTPGQYGKTLQLMGSAVRFLSRMSTSLNPEFVVTNFERDIQTAMIHLGGEHSAKLAKEVAKGVPGAMKGIHNALRGDKSHEMAGWFDRFQKAGGQISFMDLRGVEDWQKKLMAMAQDGGMSASRENIQKVFDLIGDYNSIVENAVRLSSFRKAVEAGMSESDAASLARNLTVNFNRKGELGPAINAFYMFANAGIQGSARIFTAMGKSKRVRVMMAATVMASWALAEMARLSGGDDDDGEAKWDKLVTDYQKQTNLVFMGADGDTIKVRVPYGYSTFVAMGYAMSDVFHWSQGDGGRSPVDAAKFLTSAFMQSFNPLGGDEDLLKVLSPTLVDPFLEIATNENFMGSKIAPENLPFGAQKPDSELYFRGATGVSKEVAALMNKATGGDKWNSGVVDVSPETLDHLMSFFGGGVGRMAGRIIDIPSKIGNDDLAPNDVPFLRQVYQTPNDRVDTDLFYDNIQKIQVAQSAMKELPLPARSAYLEKHPEVKLYKRIYGVRKTMSTLRKSYYAAIDKQDNKRAKAIKKQMQRIAVRFNGRFNDVAIN